jgi:hypothetical protein
LALVYARDNAQKHSRSLRRVRVWSQCWLLRRDWAAHALRSWEVELEEMKVESGVWDGRSEGRGDVCGGHGEEGATSPDVAWR